MLSLHLYFYFNLTHLKKYYATTQTTNYRNVIIYHTGSIQFCLWITRVTFGRNIALRPILIQPVTQPVTQPGPQPGPTQ